MKFESAKIQEFFEHVRLGAKCLHFYCDCKRNRTAGIFTRVFHEIVKLDDLKVHGTHDIWPKIVVFFQFQVYRNITQTKQIY